MNKYDWIFFDFDGTLVDSFSILYDIYNEFLADFGKNGTKKEFETINGPTLKQIISQLKQIHKLTDSENSLYLHYLNKVENAYQNRIKPFDGRTELLNNLKNNDFKLALVTSVDKKIINRYFKKFAWTSLFDVIVTGDEVKYSKPEPEIYEKCIVKTQTNKNRVLVLEDSQNGFVSATAAGLHCILINKKIDQKIFYD